MRKITFSFLVGSSFLGLVAPVFGQQPDTPRPQPVRPLRPQTRQDMDHVEALELYALGLLRQENDQLVEATRLFEDALARDPQAAPVYQALIPLYLALSRVNDALASCRKALEIHPDDYATWSIYARQLKNQGRLAEARDALLAAQKELPPAEHPEVRVQLGFELGVICEQLRENPQALKAFQEVVKVLDDPQSLLETRTFDEEVLRHQAVNVYERMIKICIGGRDYDRALGFFSQARSKYPAEAKRMSYVIAKIHFDRGDLSKALVVLDDHLRTQPRNIEGYELLCTILKGLGREGQIVTRLERFAEQDAQNIALQLFLAREYAEFGRPRDAERVYGKLLELSPSPEIYQVLFRFYRNQDAGSGTAKIVELLDAAVTNAAKKEKHGPDSARFAARARDMAAAIRTDRELSAAIVPAASIWIGAGSRLHHETLYFLASLASRSRRLEEAELFYRGCLGCPEAQPKEFAIYRGLIQVLWQAHKHKELVDVCRSGLLQAKAANHILFHLHLSQVWLVLGKIEEAVAEANKAVDCADPDRRLSARLNRMDVLGRADRFAQSLAEGNNLLKEYSQAGEVRDIRLRLASSYSGAGQHEKSEEQLQLVLKSDPNDTTANNDLGYQWADRGKNLEEAERLIRKAIELDAQQRKAGTVANGDEEAENAAFLDSLGWVLFRRGRLIEARQWLEKAAASAGGADDPVVWDHLGDVYFGLQEGGRAGQMWRKSLTLYEAGERRKTDAHYKELKRKLGHPDSATKP